MSDYYQHTIILITGAANGIEKQVSEKLSEILVLKGLLSAAVFDRTAVKNFSVHETMDSLKGRKEK